MGHQTQQRDASLARLARLNLWLHSPPSCPPASNFHHPLALQHTHQLSSCRCLPQDVIVRWRPEELPATSGCDSSDCAYCGALARLRRPGASPPRGASGCWLLRKRGRGEPEGAAEGAACSSCGEEDEEGDDDAEERSRRRRASHVARFPRVPSTGTLAEAAGVGAPGSSIWDHALLVEGPPGRQQGDHPWPWQPVPAGNRAAQGSSLPASGSTGSISSDDSTLSVDDARRAGGGGAAGSDGAVGWQPHWQARGSLHEVTRFAAPLPHGVPRSASAGTDIICALEFEEHGWLLACAGVTKQVRPAGRSVAQQGTMVHRRLPVVGLLFSWGIVKFKLGYCRAGWVPSPAHEAQHRPTPLPHASCMAAGPGVLAGLAAAGPRQRGVPAAAALPPHVLQAQLSGLEPGCPGRCST